VYHIDEPAVAALTQYYRKNIRKGSNILDICSSWVSHYPLEFPDTMNKIYATGISAAELAFNDQLTGGYEALDLNTGPYGHGFEIFLTAILSIKSGNVLTLLLLFQNRNFRSPIIRWMS